MDELRDRLTALAQLGGKRNQVEEFGRRYGELLAELQEAIGVLRRLGTLQGAWLLQQRDQAARVN